MFGRETTLWIEAVRAVVLLAVAFGLRLSADQIASIMLAVSAVLAVVNRAAVVPAGEAKAMAAELEAAKAAKE